MKDRSHRAYKTQKNLKRFQSIRRSCPTLETIVRLHPSQALCLHQLQREGRGWQRQREAGEEAEEAGEEAEEGVEVAEGEAEVVVRQLVFEGRTLVRARERGHWRERDGLIERSIDRVRG